MCLPLTCAAAITCDPEGSNIRKSCFDWGPNTFKPLFYYPACSALSIDHHTPNEYCGQKITEPTVDAPGWPRLLESCVLCKGAELQSVFLASSRQRIVSLLIGFQLTGRSFLPWVARPRRAVI